MAPPTCAAYLPEDLEAATLVGRVWLAGDAEGPRVVAVSRGFLDDITAYAPTMSQLLNCDSPLDFVRTVPQTACLGPAMEWLERTLEPLSARNGQSRNHLLAPCDLQSIKACGVTFVDSMLERVVEERALGNPAAASTIRASIMECIGVHLSKIVPGSAEAQTLKSHLLSQGMWSQYHEVGLGPDAEVFTKSQPMSAVGFGADVGILPTSHWNNPEPEVVLAVNHRGDIVGCTLGNDVNLRDFEGVPYCSDVLRTIMGRARWDLLSA